MIWLAFTVHPGRELLTAGLLRRRGFQVFVPTERKLVRRNRYSRRRFERLYPLLTGYVLIAFAADVPWREVFAVRAVRGVVGAAGAATPIPLAAIEHLQRLSSGAAPIAAVNPHRGFRIGDTVRVVDGAFCDLEGRVEEVHGDRARVLLGLFGGTTDASVPLAQLEAA